MVPSIPSHPIPGESNTIVKIPRVKFHGNPPAVLRGSISSLNHAARQFDAFESRRAIPDNGMHAAFCPSWIRRGLPGSCTCPRARYFPLASLRTEPAAQRRGGGTGHDGFGHGLGGTCRSRVAALLQTYPAIHQGIAVVGGLYLLWLGLGAFIKARFLAGRTAATARTTTRSLTATGTTEFTFLQSVRAGVLSSALNPKLGLLFLALMPPFIPVGSNTLTSALMLGGVFAVIGFAYLMVLTFIAARAMAWFKSPTVGIWLERISSAALAIMGAVVLVGAFASH